MVQPCSNAIAACWASATSFPVAPASRHSLSKMSRWSGPGPTMRAVGRSTSEDTNANDWSRVDGGSKILGLVTTRTKLDRTRTERANGSGPVAKWVIHVAYSACSGMESSTCAYIRTFTSGSSIPNQRLPCPNRVSSSCVSSALVRSRSTPGRGCTPRTVTNWKGGGSDVSRRFRASSNVLAIKALTLMPRASAARRTCFASWSSREIVVLMMHYHNKSSSVHQCCQTRYPLTPHTHPRTRCRTRSPVLQLPSPPRRARSPGLGAFAARGGPEACRGPARPATRRKSQRLRRTAPDTCAWSPPTCGGTGMGRLCVACPRPDRGPSVTGAYRSGRPTGPGSLSGTCPPR